MMLSLLAHVTAMTPLSPRDNSDFLIANMAKANVITLESGLQYQILESGPAGGTPPRWTDECTVNLTGKLIDDSVFDSTENGKPRTLQPSSQVKGMAEALMNMRPGDRWMLYIAENLAYGDKERDDMPEYSTLIYDVQLISVEASTSIFAGTHLDTIFYGDIRLWQICVPCGVLWLLLIWFILRTDMSVEKSYKSVVASHILVKEEAKCNELKAKLASEKFEALAKAHSICPSAKAGGKLGRFGPRAMVKQFDAVCWTAPIGEVQGPVKTRFGYHLILVTERDDGTVQPDEAKKKD